jgi:hypothetical protein
MSNITDELIAQGFPEYMLRAFYKTANANKCIILSRVPGGVGTDLLWKATT